MNHFPGRTASPSLALPALVLLALVLVGCEPGAHPVWFSSMQLQFSALFAGQSAEKPFSVQHRGDREVSLRWAAPEAPFELSSAPGDFRSVVRVQVEKGPLLELELIGMAEALPDLFASGSVGPGSVAPQ